MRKPIKPARHRAPGTSMTIAAMLTAGLLLAAPALQAKQTNDNEQVWSEWKAMGNAYVARRRQPAKLDQPKMQRRQANVQARLHKLLQQKRTLQTKLANIGLENISKGNRAQQGNSNPNKIRKQLQKLDRQIVKLTQRQAKLAAKGNNKRNKSAAWLHTDKEGLYHISLATLSATLGKTEKNLRKNARQGTLSLTTAAQADSEAANQAVSWHYDENTDSILFSARAYDTFYSAQNAYKFKLGNQKARPMPVSDDAITTSYGNETAFRDTLKFEQEPDLFYATWSVAAELDADFWFWDYLFGGVKDSIDVNLMIPDPAATGSAQIRITLRGWTDLDAGNEHQVSAEINGYAVGSSITWDAFDQAILVADFEQSILDAAGSNDLTLRNHYAPGTSPGQWLDQVEIDYQRKPVALEDTLWMHDVAPGTQIVSGFSSANIAVIESPEASATWRQDARIEPDGLGSWKVVFDTDGVHDFLITERDASTPTSAVTDNNAKLRNKRNNAEYLIIAPRDFSATAEALAAYRSSRFGHIKIAWLDDIYNQFSAGRTDPAALGRFMQYVLTQWDTSPTSVVLIGKGSLDHKDRMQYADSFLPALMAATPWGLAASDSRLLGYEVDTPFAYSRLPITHDEEGLLYLDKLARYESAPPDSERYEAVLIADNPDDAGEFHINSDLLATRLTDSLGFDQATPLYHPDHDVRSQLTDTVTWNTGYISYDGHGSVAQIGDYRENFITASDASLLTNTSYPVFTALTCAAGDDTVPGTRSLASALVLNPQGGAIVSVAPTGLSLDEDAQLLGNAFVDSLFGTNTTIGAALQDAKSATRLSISEFMPKMYSVVGVPGVYAR